ncbi:phage tail protein [Acinetobacter thermotolerans]|uniref:phage tail protein n=1 Tax=Acinetobacter thermotolerans TaxID=3151487 RepID=UPI00325AAB04
MTEYYNVTTNIGDAEIANAIATNTKLNITHIAFGDGNGSVPTPSKSRTSLVHEVHRQAVTKYELHKTNANWVVIETIIPSEIGGFTIREMGVIANGKLISHGSHAPYEKVADPTGVSEYRLRFTQNITDGSVVELTLDESLIYATQAWVDEYYVPRDEVIDNLTTNDSAKPLSAKQGKALQDGKLGKTETAVAATKLATARKIGGVNFDGTADIDLPGVNTTGNQNTTGNASTATRLQTARTIALSGGVTGTATSFDGSGDISIPVTAIDGSKITTGTIPAARIPTLNQSTTGNAATATKLQTARTINGVAFDGTANINLPTASTSTSGTVQLNNTLTSTSTTQALTAAQGKALQDGKLGKSENAVSATNCSRSIVAGNGLSGGGELNANRTLTLGTPGTITASTGNTVSASSHTHSLDIGGFFQGTKSTNGYIKLPNGIVIQWGVATEYAETSFPITFPTKCCSLVASPLLAGNDSSGAVAGCQILSTSKFKVFCGVSTGNQMYWIAMGY